MENRQQVPPADHLPGAGVTASTPVMPLHGLHRDSLGGDGRIADAACQLALDASFGSVERWREAFTADALAHAGESGWMLLVFQPRAGCLRNQWAADPAPAAVAGVPILALRRQEAAAVDKSFLDLIDWAVVYRRYQVAVHAASDPLAAPPDAAEAGAGAQLFDVRRAGVFAQASHVIPGAHWRDPAQVVQWAPSLDREAEVLVYCVHGHEVSRATALQLRASGLRARFLQGGLEGWRTSGRPLAEKPAG